ncbi:MAG TPA: hypothetical protein VH640_23810 [Bryobacteraceae bacterium]|jgi:hypothetical protein
MPTINITDQLGADIDISAQPETGSLLEKYLPAPVAKFVLQHDPVAALEQPLASADKTSLSLGFHFSDDFVLGSGKPGVTIAAQETQAVNVNANAGANLFGDDDPFGAGITVDAGAGYLSLALNGTIDPEVSVEESGITFGFNPSTGMGIEFFKRFPLNGPKPTVAEALGDVISGMVLPADVSDLGHLKPGDIAIVTGTGSFKVSGDMTLSAVPNPLASVTLPLVNQAISLQGGPSIDLAADFTISGEHRIMARKISDSALELGYYRKRGEEWSVSATATAGVGASFGKTELIEKLITAISPKADDELEKLANGALTEDQIKQTHDQIAASISHALEVSLKAEFSASDTGEAAFLYQIGMGELDETGSQAVQAALDGDLSGLTRLERNDKGDGVIAPGITMLRSSLKNTRERKASLKINLVGLLNFGSVSELIAKGETVYEPVTGELTINETVSGTSIQALVLPQSQEQLRKLRFHSLLVTTAYRASRAVSSIEVTSSDIYFAFNANTNEHTMSDYLDGMIAVGLIDAAGKAQLMTGFHSTGTSTCLIRVEFSDAACEAMFLNNGTPREQPEYEAIGRRTLQKLLFPPPGDSIDADAYRRNALTEPVWSQLKKLGNPAKFASALPELADDSLRLSVVGSDYAAITWWAESMASAAPKLAAVRAFVGQADPGTLRGDTMFQKLRDDLQQHMAQVVAISKLHFNLPLGLAALHEAALPNAVATGRIGSAALTKEFLKAVGAGI